VLFKIILFMVFKLPGREGAYMDIPEELQLVPDILIVEDETIIAIDIETRLTALGYNVTGSAKSGEEVLSILEKSRPTLILMDINLGGKMDGIQAASIIKEKYDIPVIYLTAYADENTLSRAKLTQPYGYIIKPFDGLAVRSAIETALYKYKTERKMKEDEKWLNIILNTISDAIIATDARGKILFMNPVAENLTGFARNDAMNKDLNDVYNIAPIDEDINSLVSDKDLLWEIDTSGKYNFLSGKAGSKILIKDTTTTIKDDNNNIIGVVIVFRGLKMKGS
jgi:PAS domain S-box-containing protein